MPTGLTMTHFGTVLVTPNHALHITNFCMAFIQWVWFAKLHCRPFATTRIPMIIQGTLPCPLLFLPSSWGKMGWHQQEAYSGPFVFFLHYIFLLSAKIPNEYKYGLPPLSSPLIGVGGGSFLPPTGWNPGLQVKWAPPQFFPLQLA